MLRLGPVGCRRCSSPGAIVVVMAPAALASPRSTAATTPGFPLLLGVRAPTCAAVVGRSRHVDGGSADLAVGPRSLPVALAGGWRGVVGGRVVPLTASVLPLAATAAVGQRVPLRP